VTLFDLFRSYRSAVDVMGILECLRCDDDVFGKKYVCGSISKNFCVSSFNGLRKLREALGRTRSIILNVSRSYICA